MICPFDLFCVVLSPAISNHHQWLYESLTTVIESWIIICNYSPGNSMLPPKLIQYLNCRLLELKDYSIHLQRVSSKIVSPNSLGVWGDSFSISNKRSISKGEQYHTLNQRKFRSLTSDNMDSWKSSAARKKINRCGKKEDQQARNVREVAKCCVFQCFVCRLGRKVTSLKRRVRRWLLREDMKNGTPLWREAHFQKKCASRYMLGPLFEVAMLKNCTPL